MLCTGHGALKTHKNTGTSTLVLLQGSKLHNKPFKVCRNSATHHSWYRSPPGDITQSSKESRVLHMTRRIEDTQTLAWVRW